MKIILQRLMNLGLIEFKATDSPTKTGSGSITKLKIFRRGESCVSMSSGAEFLVVVSQDFDANGEWLPSYSKTANSYADLKHAVLEIVAKGDGIVMQASNQFENLAHEIGLKHTNSEWRNL